MPAPKNNQNAVKHGAAAAEKAIQKGLPFTGLAAAAQQSVEKDFQEKGRVALIVENATRAQAAARLYWDAIAKCADEGDINKLDGYIKRFGWLVSVANRSWETAGKEQPDNKKLNVIDVLRGEQNDKTD